MAGKGKDMRNVTPATTRVAKRTVTASARARAARERQRPARAAHDTHVPPPDSEDDYDVPTRDISHYDIRMSDTVGASSSTASTDEWRLEGPTGGGPEDPILLTSFRGHVAYAIWNNPDVSFNTV